MLVNLKHRSSETELMDDPSLEVSDLRTALSDISRVNKWLGGNGITVKAIYDLLNNTPFDKEVVILDLGCGDGEMLREIARSFRKKKVHAKLIGVDLNAQSLALAKDLSQQYPEIIYINKNILDIKASDFTCDIILCTLTLHHLHCNEIKTVIQKSIQLASLGIIVNDLHRSRIAYYLFKGFSFFFIKGYIAKNDGLVSIKRGFKKQELMEYAKELSLKNYQIDWKWAFRYRWIIETK